MNIHRKFSINYLALFIRSTLLLIYYILILFLIKAACFYFLKFDIYSFSFLMIISILIGLNILFFVRYFIKQCNSFYPIQANNTIDSFCSVSFSKGINPFTSSLIFINNDLIFFSERRAMPNILFLKILTMFSNKKMINWYCYKSEKVEINIDKDNIAINGKAIAYDNQKELINELKRFEYL